MPVLGRRSATPMDRAVVFSAGMNRAGELCCRRGEILAHRLTNLLLAHAEARATKSLDSRRRFTGQTGRFLLSPWPDLDGGRVLFARRELPPSQLRTSKQPHCKEREA